MMFLISFVARLGIMPRYQKAAAWALGVLAVLLIAGLAALAFTAWVHKGQKRAVEADRAATTIETQNRVIEADRATEPAKQARDTQQAKDTEELHHEAAKGTSDAVGPGTSAVIARMREQRARHRSAAH